MARDFSRFLRPRSVALVGPEAWCGDVIAKLREMGYVWDIWPVVPGAHLVAGIRAFATIERLPAGPDLAFIGQDGAQAVETVAALARRGAGGAICQGEAIPADLGRAAGDMPLLGPGCRGVINALERAPVWDGVHGLKHVKRGVAIIARSASLAQSLSMHRRGLPIAVLAVAEPGRAQTGLALLGEALLRDERISALGIQAEDLGDPEALIEMAQTAERLGKSVVILRAGQEPGARALFERAGMAQVRSPEALLETLKILHVTGALPANTFAGLCCTGGTSALLRDLAQSEGLQFPAFSEVQRQALERDLGPGVALENPLDCSSAVQRSVPRLTRIFSEAMTGRAVLTLLVLDCAREDHGSDAAWDRVAEAAAAARGRVGMPLALLATLPEGLPEDRAEALLENRLIPLCGLPAALEALAACVALGGPLRRPAPLFMPAPDAGIGASMSDQAEARSMLAAQGLHLTPAETPPAEGPELQLHLCAEPSYGYVLRIRQGAAEVAGLLPLRPGEAQRLLEELGCAAAEIEAVVPALLSVQDYVIAQKGMVAEFELVFRPGTRGPALASGLKIRAASA
ncbi:CoA-binding protein [Salipiger bermudensis]|uniref:CoA-binding protein n=1 Tax=Salipiger bermudensis TaxID=344736 RepID=UPI001CD71ABF|nr:CoA-binding protein [Salipiger bermudensis]MCA1284511.1 CoA-binding protein [Salipiger bermudensis]